MGSVELHEAGIEELFFDPAGPVGQIMERRALAVENAARLMLREPGTGREYLPGRYLLHRGGKWYAWERTRPAHRASSPGQPPASDTGVLMASIGHDLIATDEGIGARIGSPLEYALYTELGTKNMAARPYLRPALSMADVEIAYEDPDSTPQPPGRMWFTPLGAIAKKGKR